MVIGTIDQIQAPGGLSTFPALDRVGFELPVASADFVVGTMAVAFIVGGYLAYCGRSVAIDLEERIYRRFVDAIFDFLETIAVRARTASESAVRLKSIENNHALLRVLLADARYAGVTVRLLLNNVLHLGYIAAGLAIIAIYEPVLLSFVGVFALVAGLLLYPLSLKGIASTRRLEESAPKRSIYLKNRLNRALGFRTEAQLRIDEEEFIELSNTVVERESRLDEAQENYLSAMTGRLRIIEYSRLVMALLIALAIPALILFAYSDSGESRLDYGAIFVLFFGLRFVLNGIEGFTVTVTSINRFLPNLVRLNSLIRDIDAENARLARFED